MAGVELRLRTHRDEARQWWLNAKVTDTGPGIAAGELARLFNQFEQAGGGRKFNEGSGLGLSISREYARLMAGTSR